VPLEDPGDGGRGLARSGRSDQRHRSPITAADLPQVTSWRLAVRRWRLRGHEMPAELRHDEPPRHRLLEQEWTKIATGGEPGPGVDTERSAPGGADLRPSEPPDPGRRRRGRARPGDAGAQPVERGT